MANTVLKDKEEYRYRLSSTDGSTQQYGKCDVCGGHCTEVFYQVEDKHYSFTHEGKLYEGWTQSECNSYFGHNDCLKLKQRN